MKKENLDFLKNRVYYLGFENQFDKALEQKMKANEAQFKLGTDANMESMGSAKKINYQLDFAKSEKEDRWYLNNYTATLSEAGKVQAQQNFSLNSGSGLTAREAFNMLESRSVYKKQRKRDTKEIYESWLVIDPTKQDSKGNNQIHRYHSAYNYNLSQALHEHPIKELQSDKLKSDLMYSLRKGNLVEVSFVINNENVKHHIAANPADRNIIVYDANFVRLTPMSKDIEKSQSQRPDRSEGLVFTSQEQTSKSKKNGMRV